MYACKMSREQKRLGLRLAKSIVADHGWIIRPDTSAHTTLEFIDSTGKVIFSASIIPGCFKRLCCCDKVRLTVDGGVCWLGPLVTIRLRRAIRFFVARHGNELAKQHGM